MCVYSLLCLREGEADGEGTEVRGAGMGHLRTGSSMILLLSISSIMYSTLTQQERWRNKMKGQGKVLDVKRRKTHRPEEEFGGGCAGGGEGGWEEKHFRGI